MHCALTAQSIMMHVRARHARIRPVSPECVNTAMHIRHGSTSATRQSTASKCDQQAQPTRTHSAKSTRALIPNRIRPIFDCRNRNQTFTIFPVALSCIVCIIQKNRPATWRAERSQNHHDQSHNHYHPQRHKIYHDVLMWLSAYISF